MASFEPDWADESDAQAEQMIARFAVDDPAQVQRTLRLLDREQRIEWRQDASSLAYMLSNFRYLSAQREPRAQARLEQLRSSLAYNQLASELAASEPAGVALKHRRQQITDALALMDGGHPSTTTTPLAGTPTGPSSADTSESPTNGTVEDISDGASWYDHLFLGLQARDEHDWATAERQFRQATRRKPDDAANWLLLGDILRKMHENASAAGAFDIAASLLRDNTGAIFQRGMCWLADGKLDRATDDFTTVIQRRPDLDCARLNRALAYVAQDQYELALADLNAALADGCRETRAYFVRSRVQQKLGHLQEAQADIQAGLQQTPVDAISWIARGVARMKRDPQAALDDFESALELDPTASQAWHNQAHVYSEVLDQPQQAINALNSCLQFDANDTMALAGRGVLRARLGSKESALQDAERLLAMPLDAITRYQAACIYALCAAEDAALHARALKLLAESLREDPHLADLLDEDPDLNAINGGPVFQRMASAIGVLRELESGGQLPGPQGESR